MTNKTTAVIIGSAVANIVAENLAKIARSATETHQDAPGAKGVAPVTAANVEVVAAKMLTQAPFWKSKRVWATIVGLAAATMAVPEVQAVLGAWAPMATALIGAALAAWSKQEDVRPVV